MAGAEAVSLGEPPVNAHHVARRRGGEPMLLVGDSLRHHVQPLDLLLPGLPRAGHDLGLHRDEQPGPVRPLRRGGRLPRAVLRDHVVCAQVRVAQHAACASGRVHGTNGSRFLGGVVQGTHRW